MCYIIFPFWTRYIYICFSICTTMYGILFFTISLEYAKKHDLGTINLGIFYAKRIAHVRKNKIKVHIFWGKHIHHYANTAKMLLCFKLHVKSIEKAEPALQRFNMLQMHSKQYLHLLYTTLQALKTWQTTKKQIQFGLIASDASRKHVGVSLLIGVRAHCKHVD